MSKTAVDGEQGKALTTAEHWEQIFPVVRVAMVRRGGSDQTSLQDQRMVHGDGQAYKLPSPISLLYKTQGRQYITA